MPARTGIDLRGGLRWAGIVALAGVSVASVVRWGPLTFTAPRTIYSNAHPAQRGSESLLLLFQEVRPLLPASATVAVLPADPGASALHLYLIAVGQLPDARVLPPDARGTAEFLICQARPCEEPGFRRIRDFPAGALLKRVS